MLRPECADAAGIERFKREAHASARIESEHIVEVFDAGVDRADGAPFLVMELLAATTSSKQLEKRGRLPAERLCSYLEQAARALDKTHAAGIVHRDLKPENLFLDQPRGRHAVLKILDFGIAKIIGGDGAPTCGRG